MKHITPEQAGIPSGAIARFLDVLEESRLCMHSVVILRGGDAVAEGYWKPFDAARKHRMYSVSKSFVSLAVGLMIDEGKLALEDRIVDFFPEFNPVHPLLTEATVRDMLTMCDCHDSETHSFDKLSGWNQSWFDTPPSHPPGFIHSYNTTCTNLLCAIVEKLAGTTMMEYLYPRLLDPIGFTLGCVCIRTPDGFSFGGSGVLCTPRDLARVALVCLNSGRWGDRQLISEAYVRQATSFQADNSVTNEDIEHRQGYGYHFWRTRHNGFAFYGMGCQLAICLPDADLILVTTGDTQDTKPDTSGIMSALWEEILPSLSNAPLPDNPEARAELTSLLGTMPPALADGAAESPLAGVISGKTYRLHPNEAGFSEIRFVIREDDGQIIYKNRRGEKQIFFGFGRQVKFIFLETHDSGQQIGVPLGSGYEAHASAGWIDPHTLNMLCYATDDYLGSLRLSAVFEGDRVAVLLRKTTEGFWDDYKGYLYGEAETCNDT